MSGDSFAKCPLCSHLKLTRLCFKTLSSWYYPSFVMSQLFWNAYKQLWDNLGDLNRQILVYMASNTKVNRSMLEQYTKRSSRTINNRLNSLISKGVIRSNGNNHDPKRTYSLVYSDRNK